MRRNKLFFSGILILLNICSGHGQNLKRSVIGSGGGTYNAGSIYVSSSVGQGSSIMGITTLPSGWMLFQGYEIPEVLSLGIPLTSEEWMTIYPNPSSGKFSVHFEKAQLTKFEVFNILGELIWYASEFKNVDTQEFAFSPNELVLDLSNHPSGIYFIRATYAQKTLTAKVQKI